MILDVAIAGLLWYYLHKVRRPLYPAIRLLVDRSNQSRSGMKNSDNIVDTIITFTLNTSAITCSASAGHLIFWVASPNTGVHFAFHFLVANLYTNSLYASLNARATFQGTTEHGMTSLGKHAGRSTVDTPGDANYGAYVSHFLLPMRCLWVYGSALRSIGFSIICAAPYRDHTCHRKSQYSQPPCYSKFGKAGSTDKLGEQRSKTHHRTYWKLKLIP